LVNYIQTGHSGLAVACLQAVRESPRSNSTRGWVCLSHKNHCDIQPWARVAQAYCSA